MEFSGRFFPYGLVVGLGVAGNSRVQLIVSELARQKHAVGHVEHVELAAAHLYFTTAPPAQPIDTGIEQDARFVGHERGDELRRSEPNHRLVVT